MLVEARSVRPATGPAWAAARARSSGSCAYSASPGHAVALPSRCPEMRSNTTGVPAG